jgi:hypothetical protein
MMKAVALYALKTAKQFFNKMIVANATFVKINFIPFPLGGLA